MGPRTIDPMPEPAPRPLHDRIAVITGASAGIGEATARAIVAAGGRVVVNARRADRLRTLADQLGGPSFAVAVAGDAGEPEVIRSMLDAARSKLGAGAREADLVHDDPVGLSEQESHRARDAHHVGIADPIGIRPAFVYVNFM